MPYRLLADLVVLLHLSFIVFAVFGGLLALRWPNAAWIHLPSASWAGFVELTGRICPLTPLEVSWRRAAGLESYEGDFVGRYLLPLIYPGGLTPAIQVGLGILVLAINLAVYAFVWRRRS